ncbi:hypothetical protein [Thermoplasma acidophilum]|uniref:hypothetical protein n=1 Tax=Thermoplasma acidophilum TaxID=2303 RepID=UPI00001660E8|nr:hypothetical protein [Thermoplasma acidophilum]MCY0851375.1 hypothetical protein [Thermoplasma acidophilum]
MNRKLEESIAKLRCENKPVKQIMKILSIRKDDVEKVIEGWIIDTDPFIEEIVKGRKISNLPDSQKLLSLVNKDAEYILSDPDILDYIAKRRNDHHDRFMDCIRFKIKQYLEHKNRKI